MEAVNIRIGPLTFDHADYDAEGDVLYLHVLPETVEASADDLAPTLQAA